tara:strand:+ start:667 stop:909 length:243 start_codon:yes stop_codon:yes gene_type:complete
MEFNKELDIAIAKIEAIIAEHTAKLNNLETEFADVKLNPYGITSIDFAQRQELLEDKTKMEGCVMGLKLAKETYGSIVNA